MKQTDAVAQALSYMVEASNSSFRGAWEVQAGYRGVPLLIGTVFPMAFIALTLARPELQSDTAWRLAQREAANIADLGEPQGWRYFNLYPDIPPDADDLAHVIHLLTRLSWPDRDAILEGPLAFLETNFHPDGSCNTWLVEHPDEAHAARLNWAGGDDLCHPEVLANLLAALANYAPERFAERLANGARWLIRKKQPEGWAAHWYWGWGYGTLQGTRALRAVAARQPELAAEARPAVREALETLLQRQTHEGYWIPDRSPVPKYQDAALRPSVLETAFCLEALAAGGDWAPPESRDAIRLAADWLADRQEADGAWQAEPLYFTLGKSAYQSREVTTALALGALLTAQMSHAANDWV